jgi:hypothetical protein
MDVHDVRIRAIVKRVSRQVDMEEFVKEDVGLSSVVLQMPPPCGG